MNQKTLPPNWSWAKLGNVCEINPKLEISKLSTSLAVSFLPMKAVSELSGKIDLSQTRELGTVNKGYTYFSNGDVIFAKITPCMENGKIAITDKLKNGIGFGSTEFHVLRTSENIQNKYLFHFLTQRSFRKNAQRNMTGTAGQLRVPKKYLENFEIPLPPLPEQHRIVEKIEELFSELDNGIDNLKKAKAQIKTYRQAVLKFAFEGKLVQGKEQKSKGKSENGKLPDGWNWKKFGELTENYDGKRIPLSKAVRAKRKGEYRYYGATGIIDYVDEYIFDGKYLLIGEDGANLLSKSRDLAFIVEGKFWVNNHAHIVKCSEDTNMEYLCYYINSIRLEDFVSGSAQPKLNQKNLNKIPVPITNLNQQTQIVQEIERRFSVADKMEAAIDDSLKKSEALRQSILKQAFEGKLVQNSVL